VTNRSFTQALPEEICKELEELGKQYSASGNQTLNLQAMVRLIVKTHLQELRGPTRVEKLRLHSLPKIKFYVGRCPRCHLRVDKLDFPALVLNEEGWECHICGATGILEELGVSEWD